MPLNPEAAGVVGATGVAVAVTAGFAVAVALLVGVGFVVAPEVAAALGAVLAAAVGVAAAVASPIPATPSRPTALDDPLKAGGVIESTAPSPVTVPAAIKIAFLIPALSRFNLRVN